MSSTTTPTPTAIQAATIKALTRKQGATRAEIRTAAGSKTMPNAFFLNKLAERFGYECYADAAPRTDVLVYQFVKPGAKPTAYTVEKAKAEPKAKAVPAAKPTRKPRADKSTRERAAA
jgi:hypothetical protein